ncbi:hypothetical protein Pcinc_019678 [Petrolisthes cinctipes]|uniref:Uncharacterized protein n=1 Tax=Petrolisthes cinctipes TaxID=88211 RepID=A0AAE1KHF6_PETCI|nr:hypothetical protein Pcinc_019678 [Petrolisthes cinctipes]
MGILYQNKSEEATPVAPISTDIPDLRSPQTHKKGRKRKLYVEEQYFKLYRKKPRVKSFLYKVTAPGKRPDNCKDGKLVDLAWMMCHALQLYDIPMWVGFSSLLPNTTPKNGWRTPFPNVPSEAKRHPWALIYHSSSSSSEMARMGGLSPSDRLAGDALAGLVAGLAAGLKKMEIIVCLASLYLELKISKYIFMAYPTA